jgi:LacI family transcriptional regulator
MPEKPLKPITLQELADHLSLSRSTVSRIINGEAATYRIAEETEQRVLQAAALLGYTAKSLARSLRQKRSYTIGVLVSEIGEGYSAAILGGIEEELLSNGFFYFVVSHRHRNDLLNGYPRMLISRAVEGIIAIDTPLTQNLPVPLVFVSGQRQFPGAVTIQIDHAQAAHLGLSHLKSLGHTHIAYIKGMSSSADTEQRWQAIHETAAELGLPIDPALVVALQSSEPGNGPGNKATRQLLQSGHPFTALFAFNDVTAIGAIQALREAGLHVPKDVSVLGFDDVAAAATSTPPLTTLRQPLRDMGQTAASTLLSIIRNELDDEQPSTFTVQPNLIVRKSTSHAPRLLFSTPAA